MDHFFDFSVDRERRPKTDVRLWTTRQDKSPGLKNYSFTRDVSLVVVKPLVSLFVNKRDDSFMEQWLFGDSWLYFRHMFFTVLSIFRIGPNLITHMYVSSYGFVCLRSTNKKGKEKETYTELRDHWGSVPNSVHPRVILRLGWDKTYLKYLSELRPLRTEGCSLVVPHKPNVGKIK